MEKESNIAAQAETLCSVNEYLVKLKDGIKKIVNYIQEGKEHEAIQIIPNAAEGIDWVIQAINLTKDAQKEEIAIDDINDHISEMVDAFENDDFILVGDLFEYEILPILDRVQKEVEKNI